MTHDGVTPEAPELITGAHPFPQFPGGPGYQNSKFKVFCRGVDKDASISLKRINSISGPGVIRPPSPNPSPGSLKIEHCSTFKLEKALRSIASLAGRESPVYDILSLYNQRLWPTLRPSNSRLIFDLTERPEATES